ncbi:MAG: transcription termination factor Rho [Solirubrobacterales bacterium]
MAAELKDLHLADLHQRAAVAGLPGYRKLGREQLIEALGAHPDAAPAAPGREAEEPDADPAAPGREAEEAAGSGVVVEATVLDPEAEEPVELGPEGPEAGDESAEDHPTHEIRGVLELTRQRYGFLRLAGLSPSEDDVYISAAQVRRCELRPGDEVEGPARDPRRGERHRALVHVDRVNGEEPLAEERPEFDTLPPIPPERRLRLEGESADLLARAVDLFTPLAFGQRVLIRAAARSGRTTLLRSLARAAAANEGSRVIVLLIDERPEEATAWREAVPVAEFAIATADLAPIEQVRIAELALERARRRAEIGEDAVLVCDSLSRLAFAAGNADDVKRLFGSGRNLAGGGSLTVLATVLADGSDEGEAERAVLTTESSLIVLDPELAAAGVHPAIRPAESRVSNEDQLREPEELDAVRRLRSQLTDLRPADAAALLRERIETTSTNAELLDSL